MTIDDEKSVYVGGLPYDATEEKIRDAFQFYGSVVAVKIINDRRVGGKCYGFVTFRNPRSAYNAIREMNGKTIGGRVIKVNEVNIRGGRPNFGHESVRRIGNRGMDRERARDRERDYDHDRDRHQDHVRDNSWDRDQERNREYEHEWDHDRARDRSLERDQDQDRDMAEFEQERSRIMDLEQEREVDMDQRYDLEMDRANDHHKSVEKDVEQKSRRNRSHSPSNDRRAREISSNSSEDYIGQSKEILEEAIHRHEELQKEKLEDAVAAAKKLSSQRKMHLTKLCKSYLQVQTYAEKLKSSEQEFESLMVTAKTEVDMGDLPGEGYDQSTI
ncbi:RNA recognition motif domain [Dillenia turbinata]|uniref:RNA recognition motif domain n=1 Tax=Dillenia turbinata TaxID=194707 RepID=A0AAN8ZL88_9MAGN